MANQTDSNFSSSSTSSSNRSAGSTSAGSSTSQNVSGEASTSRADTSSVGSDAMKARLKDFGDKVRGRVGEFPAYGRDIAAQVDRSARANPWMHIGFAGAGAFALGILIGRAFSGSAHSEIKGFADHEDLEVDD